MIRVREGSQQVCRTAVMSSPLMLYGESAFPVRWAEVSWSRFTTMFTWARLFDAESLRATWSWWSRKKWAMNRGR